ncbi:MULTISPECIES: SAM-dependent methyltransferase [Streptomyces]|uniref:SAM-dependent methyltransferase n=1 Tax=Streptomyces TaxID=1883 RepID=UPI001CCE10F9|nr:MULTISPECIES: SAM-dependent methyltransferase [Streptomyces]MBZ6172055.1 SAM-dependent methyltransferase [Streptomyces olivaceus]MBZ6181109.1 SAM-dependent methyltransferase [Streptomyces olivaceus]MCM8554650.1 SAM-dependent methyltransferase [Streptomyces sp. STCH 565 A]WFB84923.1 SAM-dependent methyltransferase [Streptomyces olivaceus]WGK49455.1 SAM-dependent methyltransferase [Streptomyces sp. B146]
MSQDPRGNDRRADVPGLPAGVGLTALSMAFERCAESRRPDRLFEDRFAVVLTEHVKGTLRMMGTPGGGVAGDTWAFLREFVALRTRFFDDTMLTASLDCPQVVLLGAGMDSRAYRLAWPAGREVYEVDRGDVLRFKDGIAARMGDEPRCGHTQVEADIRGDWPGALRAAGFDPWRPTVWSAEGLLPYLSAAENNHLLSRITAMSANGSRLVADHFDRALELSAEFTEMAEVLCAAGASWRSTLDDPESWLGRHGWTCRTTDPAALGRLAGRELSPLFHPDSTGGGHMWLVSAGR